MPLKPDAYPEHEKLAGIKDQSQPIGEFLDYGLAKLGLALYERTTRPCEAIHKRCVDSGWHSEEEKATIVNPDSTERDGRVLYTEWVPTHRTITTILAEWFEIDLEKIKSEKWEMLKTMREANAR